MNFLSVYLCLSSRMKNPCEVLWPCLSLMRLGHNAKPGYLPGLFLPGGSYISFLFTYYLLLSAK